jgi:hypothetical protein
MFCMTPNAGAGNVLAEPDPRDFGLVGIRAFEYTEAGGRELALDSPDA